MLTPSSGPQYGLTPGTDPVGKQTRAGGDVSHAVGCSSPCPDQSCTCSLLQPGRTDSSSGRFVPGNVQFRPFSAVTTNCYPNGSWQLGSDCCLGSSATRRESRNRTVLYVLQLSAKAELDMTSQELVLPSKEWFDFVNSGAIQVYLQTVLDQDMI